MIPNTANKGTRAKLIEQYEGWAKKLGLESIEELFTISVNAMIQNVILFYAMYGQALPMSLASVYTASEI